jgi:hypothetical protein
MCVHREVCFSSSELISQLARSSSVSEARAATRSATGPATILQRRRADRDCGASAVDSRLSSGSHRNIRGTSEARNAPLHAARIEDLGPGDFAKVDCAACHHVALLTPEALLRSGLSPGAKVLDIRGRLRCRGCGRKGRAVVSIRRRWQST